MLHTKAPRALLNNAKLFSQPLYRKAWGSTLSATKTHQARPLRPTKAVALTTCRPMSLSIVRRDINRKHEQEVAHQKLEAHPESVSLNSSVTPVLETRDEGDVDMMAGIRSDINTIKETFSIADVPREVQIIGVAGVLPYLATSLTTVFLAWDIGHIHDTGSGVIFSGPSAEALLHIIEPIQIGYGAVILSFLSAVHWGLEFAGYGGYQRYKRYAIGIVTPGVAWATIFLPVESALIAQFLAFCALYYVDARSTVRGWSPQWYAMYRFMLTGVVGISIIVSLIGRGHIGDRVGRADNPADRMRRFKDTDWEKLEAEERERQAAEADDEDEDGEEAEDDD